MYAYLILEQFQKLVFKNDALIFELKWNSKPPRHMNKEDP